MGATVPKVAPPSVRLPDFTHVVVVVFENHEASSIAGNADAPTFNELARRYATLTKYDAVAHPSLPNYLALVSGSTHGISSDCTDCVVHARNLADTLAAAGKTWKTYAEDLPYPGFTGGSSGRYAKKHDPFLYFRDVARSRARRDRVVPFTRLGRDLARHRLPDFSLVVPNLCNDMHDCSVATGDAWLKAHVVPLLHSPELRGGVVFVVFDEGTSDTGGGGRIAALALGPTVRRGSRFTRATNHYGLLRTIEDAWRLPRLGFSAHRNADRRDLEEVGVRARRGIRADMLASIARALEERDHTLGHGARVAALAEPVALELGWDRERIRSLRWAAPLHDVGKVQIRPQLLGKSGPLTLEEVAEIRSHPAAGAKLVMPLRRFHDALPYVLFHHERWDGDGYPAGLSGRRIPIEARILAIADAFDAMISPRPYRRALTHEHALAEVEEGAGAQFDPVAAELFVEAWADGWDVWQRAASPR